VSSRGGRRSGQEALFESRNLLFYGDNLYVLREHIRDETVDLVYLDPPFNKGKDHDLLFTERTGRKPAAQVKAFEDTWKWDDAAWEAFQETVRTGPPKVSEALQSFRRLVPKTDMLAYLSMMAPRLVELQRKLRKTGSIYLHCDPTASHYLKLLMDAVFGPTNFRNEIAWCYTGPSSTKRWFPRKHDIILFYVKSPEAPFYKDAVRVPYAKSLRSARGRTGIYAGREYADMDARVAQYDVQGKVVEDWWPDITPVGRRKRELLHYPTQKPKELVERIIRASTLPRDVVLDPFCGCGTTVDAAQALDRRWIGIDIAKVAIDVIEGRLEREYGADIRKSYEVRPEPASAEDAYTLADEDKHNFEEWALHRVGADSAPHKRGADKGIDGRMYYFDHIDGESKLIVVSVKGGSTGPGHVRDLRGVMEREKAAIGVFVTRRKPTKAMREEADEAGTYYSAGLGRMVQRLQIITVEDLFDPEKKKRPVDFPAEAVPITGAPGLPEAIPAQEDAKLHKKGP